MKPYLDYSQSYMSSSLLEASDGILLGDGHIAATGKTAARMSIGVEHEEFCRYLMSYMKQYDPLIAPRESESMKSGVVWSGATKSHPDLLVQRNRWYIPQSDGTVVKRPPDDVMLTSLSVRLWYLGDGSVVQTGKNTVYVRLSTDGFEPAAVEVLSEKLNRMGISCHRNEDNRIYIETRGGVPSFFNLIGKTAPLECYHYKFALPTWRFESKRMREVADELQIDYQKLAYWTKIGRVPCFRASAKGKPRFLPEHIEKVKEMLAQC